MNFEGWQSLHDQPMFHQLQAQAIRNAVMAEAPLKIFTVPLDSVGADRSLALLKS
jgi:hypothetical protein